MIRPSSSSSTDSDAMSGQGQANGAILMLHAPDGSRWSTFISTRLEAKPYGFPIISKDLTILEGPPEDEDVDKDKVNDEADGNEESGGDLYLNTAEALPNLTSGVSKTEGDDNNNTSSSTGASEEAEGEAPPLEGRTSSEMSDAQCEEGKNQTRTKATSVCSVEVITLTDNSSIGDCIMYSRACVIFLSPDIIEGGRPFPIDIADLNPRSTLFLFLGVDREEVRQYFGDLSDLVFRCLCSHIDGSEVSIKDALVQVVHAYEDSGGSSILSSPNSDHEDDGDGVYQLPPSSVLQNRLERVFPRELTGGDRLVYVLLEKLPEHHDVVVQIGPARDEFPLTQVCGRLFSFNVPDGLSGNVSFVIGSQGKDFGSDSVRVLSRLDQLREILAEEADPKTILAQAVGVAPGKEAELDTALAFRLQQLASAKSFAAMFPVEEGLQNKGAAKQVLYPSLLHFAAEYNLRTFCSELLKYPSMVGAARAENRDGETAQQVAARKKFVELESDLAEFATKHGLSQPGPATQADAEDNMYVAPTAATSPRGPPPPPHRVSKPGYVNAGVESYVTMGEVQLPGRSDLIDGRRQKSQTDATRLKANANRELPATPKVEDEEYQNMETVRTDSGISHGSRSNSDRCTSRSRLDSPDGSPHSEKAFKRLGISPEEFNRRNLPPKSKSFERDGDQRPFSTARKGSAPAPFFPGAYRESYSSNYDQDQFDANEQISPKQSKSGNKFLKIFKRSRGKDKRSSSISEMESANIKTALGGRGKRRGSESSVNTSQAEAPDERDSGSYSDEEKEKPVLPSYTSAHQKTFQERTDALGRRLSRRMVHAMNEKIDTAPTLPSKPRRPRPGKRGVFKSYIED